MGWILASWVIHCFIIFIIVEKGLEFGFLGCSLYSFIIFMIVERGLECGMDFLLSVLFIVLFHYFHHC